MRGYKTAGKPGPRDLSPGSWLPHVELLHTSWFVRWLRRTSGNIFSRTASFPPCKIRLSFEHFVAAFPATRRQQIKFPSLAILFCIPHGQVFSGLSCRRVLCCRFERCESGTIAGLSSVSRAFLYIKNYCRPQEWSISNFSCSLTRNIMSHSMKNLAFHSLLSWKMMRLPILIISLIHYSL